MLDSHLLRATDSLAVSSAPRGRSAPRSSRATSDIDTVRTPTTLTRHRSTRFARSRCHPLPRRFAGGRGDDRGARTGGRLRPSTRPRARACEPRCHHSSAHNVTECERASVRLGSLLGHARSSRGGPSVSPERLHRHRGQPRDGGERPLKTLRQKRSGPRGVVGVWTGCACRNTPLRGARFASEGVSPNAVNESRPQRPRAWNSPSWGSARRWCSRHPCTSTTMLARLSSPRVQEVWNTEVMEDMEVMED